MRTYGQFCGLARALDVVGDRWTLLIVRELAIRQCRYTDLRDGLPGIATNLLADRLRHLDHHGVIARTDAPPPIAAPIYALTPLGRGLVPILVALTRWATPLVAQGQHNDEFRGHWLVIATAALYETVDVRDLAPLTIGLHADDEPVTLEITVAGTHASTELATDPDVVISADPQTLIALLSGTQSLAEARAAGASVMGPSATLKRFRALTRRAAHAIGAA